MRNPKRNFTMRGRFRTAAALCSLVLALALSASGAAFAQQMPDPPQAGPGIAGEKPGIGSPNKAEAAREEAVSNDQDQKAKEAQQTPAGKLGTEEPSSRADLKKDWEGPPLVNGAWAVMGAPADMQTVPAKFSARNSALDATPILAHPLPIDDAERTRIAGAIKAADRPVAAVKLGPAQLVPLDVDLNPLPQEFAGHPMLDGLAFVRLEDRILLVQPRNRVVVGELVD
jgi:hypothetical protein